METPLWAALLGAALASAAAPGGAAEIVAPEYVGDGVYLAPAPRFDPDSTPAQPPAGPRPKAVSSVPAINTFDNAAVVSAYNTYWNVGVPTLGFTGSVAGCNPGSINPAYIDWTGTRINFLRAMAGVPGNTTMDASLNAQEQAAALIMSANNTLTHSPTAGMACYSAAGAAGAGSSNIALGVTDAIPLYMSDPGAGNEVAGHRRWILHSAKTRFALGVTTPPGAGALYTFDNANMGVAVAGGIPWPPRGFVPLDLFPTLFISSGQRWSFGMPGANFSSATVTLARNGTPVAVNVSARNGGYGDSSLVWELPNGHAVTNGSVYDVTVSGVGNASASSYSYQVLAFDPAANTANISVTHVSPPATGSTGKDIVYTLNVANAGPAPASPVTLTDTLPAGAQLIWASPGCSLASGVVTCNVGTLASGGSRQVKIVVRPASAGAITNTASVSGSPADPSMGNNASAAGTTIATSTPGTAVMRYRLYSPVTKEHHFTTDLNEYNVLGNNGNWNQEGTVGKVLNNPGTFNAVAAVPYYRLYNAGTQWHHWTTDANEYYTLAGFPGWSAEGVDGYILPTPTAGATQLYRLLYPFVAGGLHHWTIDPVEYATLISTYGWIGEGGSGYVIQ